MFKKKLCLQNRPLSFFQYYCIYKEQDTINSLGLFLDRYQLYILVGVGQKIFVYTYSRAGKRSKFSTINHRGSLYLCHSFASDRALRYKRSNKLCIVMHKVLCF